MLTKTFSRHTCGPSRVQWPCVGRRHSKIEHGDYVETIDALIIGGGPAGSTAAILLAKAGRSVMVVEGKAFPRRKVCGEYLSATNWPLLAKLGIDEVFGDLAGPPVERTAVFSGNRAAFAQLPRPANSRGLWGRSLAREHLDTLLLANAAKCGAEVRQPWRCVSAVRTSDSFECELSTRSPDRTMHVKAGVVIAAHGSWETGNLVTQRQITPAKPSEWLAFKAHFRNADLPAGLMPLLSFPDGYGGMVHCDGGRVSLSCCIRRSRLAMLPRSAGQSAGDAVCEHILATTPVLRRVLDTAEVEDAWLSAGPIQPGFRSRYQGGVFVVGNAAGEAHPVVAEGISMAMQSAWLICDRLIHNRDLSNSTQAALARSYSKAWAKAFASRIYAASAVAHWASRPSLVAATLPLFNRFPNLLTFGAQLSGKAKSVVPLDDELLTRANLEPS